MGLVRLKGSIHNGLLNATLLNVPALPLGLQKLRFLFSREEVDLSLGKEVHELFEGDALVIRWNAEQIAIDRTRNVAHELIMDQSFL